MEFGSFVFAVGSSGEKGNGLVKSIGVKPRRERRVGKTLTDDGVPGLLKGRGNLLPLNATGRWLPSSFYVSSQIVAGGGM